MTQCPPFPQILRTAAAPDRTACSSRPRQFLIAQPVRLLGLRAQPLPPLRLVRLVVALAPHGLAVPFKGQEMLPLDFEANRRPVYFLPCHLRSGHAAAGADRNR